MSSGANEARRPDDEETHRDALFGGIAHCVHEDRHGKNGAASAKDAEREADGKSEHVADHDCESTATASATVRAAQRRPTPSRIFIDPPQPLCGASPQPLFSMHRPLAIISVSGMLAAFSVTAIAQAPKRALTPDDWDHWRSISWPAISNDGRWVVYSLVPQVGDGELIVRATSGSNEYRIQRGFIGRPQMVAGARDTTNASPPAQITSDNKFALALTYAPMSEFERARREKRRPADQPKASLAIVDLSSGQVTSVPRVRSFRTARDAGTWVAYLLEPTDSNSANRAARDSSARATAPQANAAAPGGRPRPVSDSTQPGRRPEYGSTLVLRNL